MDMVERQSAATFLTNSAVIDVLLDEAEHITGAAPTADRIAGGGRS